MHTLKKTAVLMVVVSALTSCSGGSDNTTGAALSADNPDTSGTDTQIPGDLGAENDPNVTPSPSGAVEQYAAVTVADGDGTAIDLSGSFFTLDSGASADYLLSRFSTAEPMCRVQNEDAPDINDLSVVYLPDVPGVKASAVSAGDSIILTSTAGDSYATLFEQRIGDLIFYDLEFGVEATPVPAGLIVDIPSGGGFPTLTAASMPGIEPLRSFSFDTDPTISPSTQFSWTPSATPGSLLTISTATGNGFFLDTSLPRYKVTCLVPDTGSFSFPADVQNQLGASFSGKAPSVSRLAVNPVLVDSTVFYVIRESFL